MITLKTPISLGEVTSFEVTSLTHDLLTGKIFVGARALDVDGNPLSLLPLQVADAEITGRVMSGTSSKDVSVTDAKPAQGFYKDLLAKVTGAKDVTGAGEKWLDDNGVVGKVLDAPDTSAAAVLATP